MNKQNQIGVHPIFRGKKLVGIIKRDDDSKKNIVYKTEEADCEWIAEMMTIDEMPSIPAFNPSIILTN